jgi:acetyl-CoA carboxylase beta subunit
MIRQKCDECGGKLAEKKIPYILKGVLLGEFLAEVCSKCSEVVFSEEVSREMTQKSREMGLWDLEAKTKVGKVVDALDVRFPKKIVEFLNLKKGQEVRIHPEKKKIVIDL